MSGPVIHVLDASRAVGVASSLVSDTQREPLIAKTAEEYRRRSARSRAGRGQSELATLAEARANAFPWDPTGKAPAPQQPGRAQFQRLAAARAARRHRLDALLPRLGTGRQLSRDPRRRGGRRKRAQPVRRRAGDARPDHRRALADARGDGRPVALPPRGRRCARARRQRRDPRCRCFASR